MIDKNILQIHFSRNAESYDSYAKVQKKMARELLSMIKSDVKESMGKLDILDIGCGTGHLTGELLALYPDSRITAVDIAPGMIEYAKRKFIKSGVEFICMDIEEAVIGKQYDLIISNATFQWFNNFEETLLKLGRMLKNDGVLAFSTFGHMTFSELLQSYEIACKKLQIDKANPPSQKFYRPDEVLSICKDSLEAAKACSFEFAKKDFLEYEYFNSVKEFLDSVKKIGANNSNKSHKPNIALTKEMMETYEDIHKIDGLIKATYHCVFIEARKIPINVKCGK